MHFQIPSTGGYKKSTQYKLYPTHAQIPRKTPMDRAVKIAGALTTAIQNLLTEPTINRIRHGQALEQLTKISDNATENLETQLHHKAQTLSTPTTRANIWATPRVHARVTRKNTPGIIPTTIINKEGGKDFSPSIADLQGGQKSKRKINSKNERKTRQENRELAKKLNDECKADSYKASTTPKQVPVVEKPIFQMEHVEQGTPRPSFGTPRIISQEALIAFSLAAVGIKRIFPLTTDNQDSNTKTIAETHSQKNIQHFCAPVIHPKTG